MSLAIAFHSPIFWEQSSSTRPRSSSSVSILGGGGRCSARVWSPATRVRSSGAGDGDGPPRPPSPGPPKKGFGSGGGFKKKEKATTEGKRRGGGSGGKGMEQEGMLIGRGSNTSEKNQSSSGQLNKVVDIVDKKSSVRSSIDPSEARLGKVDFVRVQNWGSEGHDAPKLEDLKVKSFSPAASSTQNKSNGPFYEKLVNRLQLLESKGEIAVVQAKPLPSFDRWAFGEDRYTQFLVDQRSVFEALRDGIVAVRNERCKAVAENLNEVVPFGGAASAISLFEVELGLDRCEALNADITSIINSSAIRGESGLESLAPNTQAIGYAKVEIPLTGTITLGEDDCLQLLSILLQYLRQLGRTTLADGEKAKEACLKLLAHVFAVYVSHLTTGMRIGAKALDNVESLRQTKALSFYRDYPLQVKDPLKLFIATINSAGSSIALDEDHEQSSNVGRVAQLLGFTQVMEELAKAFQRTSLLLSVLAVEEPLMVAYE